MEQFSSGNILVNETSEFVIDCLCYKFIFETMNVIWITTFFLFFSRGELCRIHQNRHPGCVCNCYWLHQMIFLYLRPLKTILELFHWGGFSVHINYIYSIDDSWFISFVLLDIRIEVGALINPGSVFVKVVLRDSTMREII